MLLLLLLVLAQPPVDPFAKWEKEIAAIEKRLRDSPPKPDSVFFIGSSTIRLWDLKKSFPDLSAANVGFGGSRIPDSTHFAPRIILPFKPKAIVFYAGDNDLAGGHSPKQVADDFAAFAAAIHKDLPKTRIVFIAVKPSIARWKLREKQQEANSLVKDVCGKDPRLEFLDLGPKMLDADGKPNRDLFVKDGLHMTSKGYEIWSPAVAEALK
jgi:lysophospholipase L1-like esterase